MIIVPLSRSHSPSRSRIYRSRSRSLSRSRRRSRSRSPDLFITHQQTTVASKGNVNATFEVPGLISIPSDGVAHNVTIVQLQLEATMSWVSVPKKDPNTHLSVRPLLPSSTHSCRASGACFLGKDQERITLHSPRGQWQYLCGRELYLSLPSASRRT